jgi:prepilin-type N-terminal cleavage/methylation domain-containing protein
MPMSRPMQPADRGHAGFSLIEILVVLAIFALATAIIMPGTSRMLDQATSHAVFFEFQRQISDLRREANRTGVAIRVEDPAVEITPDAAPEVRQVVLRAPWRYTLAPALNIEGGGACSATSANLIRGDAVIMTMRSEGTSCRFIRVIPAAGRRTEPSL